eukprot:scaffold138187_cov127-Phaeocystis_antarctica.AAC.1
MNSPRMICAWRQSRAPHRLRRGKWVGWRSTAHLSLCLGAGPETKGGGSGGSGDLADASDQQPLIKGAVAVEGVQHRSAVPRGVDRSVRRAVLVGPDMWLEGASAAPPPPIDAIYPPPAHSVAAGGVAAWHVVGDGPERHLDGGSVLDAADPHRHQEPTPWRGDAHRRVHGAAVTS